MSSNHKIEPVEIDNYLQKSKASSQEREELSNKGNELIRDGKVCVVVMAGGQGTRLGFDHPKGMYRLPLLNNKSIF